MDSQLNRIMFLPRCFGKRRAGRDGSNGQWKELGAVSGLDGGSFRGRSSIFQQAREYWKSPNRYPICAALRAQPPASFTVYPRCRGVATILSRWSPWIRRMHPGISCKFRAVTNSLGCTQARSVPQSLSNGRAFESVTSARCRCVARSSNEEGVRLLICWSRVRFAHGPPTSLE